LAHLPRFKRIRLVTLFLMLTGVTSLVLLAAPAEKAAATNPNLINFQGKVVNSDGTNVTDGNYNFSFVLFDDPTTGTESDGVHDKWHELSKSVTVTNGIFQTELGSATSLPDFSANSALYLAIKFNGDTSGSNGGYMSPRVHLDSVPYALNSDKLGGISASGFIQNGTSTQSSSNFHISGTGQADTALQTPVVDSQSAAAALGIGTTNAGTITMGNVTNSTFLFKTKSSTTALQVQGSGGTEILTADSQNSKVAFRGINSVATLGSELFSSSTCSGTGWSGSGTGPYTHTTGSANTLTCSPPATVTVGATYQISYSVGGSITAGETVTPSIGSIGGKPVGDAANDIQLITAAFSTLLTFTPTTNFNGTITITSLKQLTQTANSVLSINNSDNTAGIEIRAGGSSKNNTFIGLSSGQSNTTGVTNVSLGNQALQNNTTGTSNTAIGYQALNSNTNGGNNTAIGQGSLNRNTIGNSNVGVGDFTLNKNTTGNNNAALGYNSLNQNTAGSSNVAFGTSTLTNNITGSNNTATGGSSLINNTTGSNNTGQGYQSLAANTTGSNNAALGYSAGYQDPTVATFATPSNLQNATMVGYAAQQCLSPRWTRR
jgi:hypothetical protein